MTVNSTISFGVAIAITGPIIGTLLAMNIFFLKQLVDKINATACAMPKVLSAIENFDRRQTELSEEVKDLKKLEPRLAFVEGILKALTATGVESGAASG